MSSYQQDFHGLVHFIYINRQNGHMTAPSMDKSGQMVESEENFQLLASVCLVIIHFQTAINLLWSE